MSDKNNLYAEVIKSKYGTPESRKRLIEVLKIAHDPNLTFEQAMQKLKDTRRATHEDKEPSK